MTAAAPIKLALLDRDGVLNEDRPDSVTAPDQLVLLPRAAAAVARLNRAGVRVAVVTNQSVVGRGLVSESELDRIHGRLETLLARQGAHLDALLVAPDAPEQASERRKPGPGMLQEAMARFAAGPGESIMIGDALRDLEAAAAAGCARVLVLTGKGAATRSQGLPDHVRPVTVRDDLWDAVERLLAAPQAPGGPTAARGQS